MAKSICSIDTYTIPIRMFEDKEQADESRAFCSAQETYDKLGNLMEEVKYLEDGSVDEKSTFTYDEQGRLTEERIYHALTENEDIRKVSYEDRRVLDIVYYGDDPGEETTTLNDEHGHPLEIRRTDPDGELEEIIQFTYRKPGIVAEEVHLDGGEEPLKRIRSHFNEEDQLVGQEIWSADPNEINQTIEITREEHKEISKALDEKGNLMYTRIHEFDERGNLIRFIHQDTSGAQSVRETEFDDQNRPVALEWRNENGMVFRSQQYTYNEEGEVTEEMYFESDPYSQQNVRQKIRYHYQYFE